jgi:hypothetical protein
VHGFQDILNREEAVEMKYLGSIKKQHEGANSKNRMFDQI